jgi:glycosyltransferase involved in cell wall biosynthesis
MREHQFRSRPLRIEMVLPALLHGGMEQVVLRLSVALRQRGHHVNVVCLEELGPLQDAFRAGGIPVTLVPTPGLRTNIRANGLKAHFALQKPDVVHSHSGVWLKTARAARAVSTPRVVHTVHGLLDSEPAWGRWMKRLAARYTDWIVPVSEPLKKYLRDNCGIPAHQLIEVPNGVDTTKFAPIHQESAEYLSARRRVAGDWAGDLLIGHVARLAAIKNQRLLLDAFKLVIGVQPRAKLIVAGDGPLREELRAQAEVLELANHVRFLGAVTDVPSWLPALDAFVLSSNAEGTSMSILEALSCGVPVVATDVGGNANALGNGSAGLLVPPRDARAMAEAIVRVLNDRGLAGRIASAGLELVASRFSEQHVVSTYETMYRGLPARANFLESNTCAV